MKVGDKYENKSGMVGTLVYKNHVLMLEVRNDLGRIKQMIMASKLDITKFKKVEDD